MSQHPMSSPKSQSKAKPKSKSEPEILREALESWMERQNLPLHFEDLAASLEERPSTVREWARANSWPDAVLEKLARLSHGKLITGAADAKKRFGVADLASRKTLRPDLQSWMERRKRPIH